jgi:heme/copper-type cytochrome/quinol oxidase subunit 2
MESKSGGDPQAYVLPHIRNLTAEEARELHRESLTTWLATVALVLVVIVVALSVAARRERKKQTEDAGAQITASRGVNIR